VLALLKDVDVDTSDIVPRHLNPQNKRAPWSRLLIRMPTNRQSRCPRRDSDLPGTSTIFSAGGAAGISGFEFTRRIFGCRAR
jgi:hypothetical protein